MVIEDVPISYVKPYEKNPRKNDKAVDGVAESIKQFGFKQPIVIDKNGVIVAGHTRYKAALKLGFDTVPCVRADDLTQKQIKAYRILDNKLNELASWDFEMLGEELETFEFDFEPFDVEMPTFDWKELLDEEKYGVLPPLTELENDTNSENSNSENKSTSKSTSYTNITESQNEESISDDDKFLPPNRKRIIIWFCEEQSNELAKLLGLSSLDKDSYEIEELIN